MSREILVSIRQALGYDELDKSHDEEIKKMSPDEQFSLYCQWHGLLGGWSDKLKDVVLELF